MTMGYFARKLCIVAFIIGIISCIKARTMAEGMAIIHTQQSRNMLRCQRMCAYTNGCERVAFNGGRKTCHLLGIGCGEVLKAPDWIYANKAVLASSNPCCGNPCETKSTCLPTHLGDLGYQCHRLNTSTTACPVSLGYNVHALDGSDYCLKYDATRLYIQDAISACRDQCAHLIGVKGRQMLDDLGQLLITLGHGTSSLFIDGHKTYNNDTVYTWDGEVQTYEDWSPSNPKGNGHDWLKIIHNGTHYLMADTIVSVTKPYLCQFF